jgi:hypothetical protein
VSELGVQRWRFRGIDWATRLVDLAEAGAHGRSWYGLARYQIRDYADRQGVSEAYVADVLSILSPRVSVEMNVELTRDYIERGLTDRCMRQRAQALERYERTGTFGGPKVNAFSRALQGDQGAVVIDAWMFRACGDLKPNKRNYARAVAMVENTADVLDWTPAQTQAAVWTGIRELVGFRSEGVIRL